MREKILAQLIAKYAGVSKTALGLVADKIAKKVTEESGIDGAITDFDNAVSITEFAADLQRESDRRVGEAKKEWEKKNPPKKDPPKTDPKDEDDPPKNDEAPGWAKALMEKVETLTKEKAQGTIKTKATEKLKDVPAKFWNGRALPEKEEDLETFVEAVTKDFNDFKQEQIDAGFMSATPPGGGGAGGGTLTTAAEKAMDAGIDAWVKTKEEPKK